MAQRLVELVGAQWRADGRATNDARPTVLDPAVGHGAFLLAAAPVFGPGQPAARSAWAATHLFGMDIDAAAVTAAISAVAEGLVVPPAALRRHIVVGDALERAGWATAFHRHSAPSFDIVVLNPPWLSFGNRQSHTLSAERREYLRRAFPLGFAGFPSSHGAFLELAADLTADTGYIGALVPQPVAHAARYSGVRTALTRRHELRECVRIGEDEFANVVEPAVLLVFGPKRTTTVSVPNDQWLSNQAAPPSSVTGAQGRGIASYVAAHGPAAHVLRALRAAPTLEQRDPTLFRDIGVHTGSAAKDLISRTPQPAPEWLPVRRGRDLWHGIVRPPSEWLKAPPWPVGFRTPPRMHSVADYVAVPLLVRQTADRPLAALHATGVAAPFRNSVLAAIPSVELSREWPLAALMVWLNSALAAFFHRATQPDAQQRTSPQVKIRHLRALPVPPCSAAAITELAHHGQRLVDLQLARAASADATAEPRGVSPAVASLNAELGRLEARVDAVVAAAFGLSASDMAAVRAVVEPWTHVGPH